MQLPISFLPKIYHMRFIWSAIFPVLLTIFRN